MSSESNEVFFDCSCLPFGRMAAQTLRQTTNYLIIVRFSACFLSGLKLFVAVFEQKIYVRFTSDRTKSCPERRYGVKRQTPEFEAISQISAFPVTPEKLQTDTTYIAKTPGRQRSGPSLNWRSPIWP